MNLRRNRGGQALIMVTLMMIPMFGLMGLAMDLSWAYYQQKTTQAAADAAALAAVRYAFTRVGKQTFLCGSSGVECAPPSANPVDCPGSFAGSLAAACTSASDNGFTNAGQQTVNVLACVPTDAVTCPTQAGCLTAVPASCIPTAPGVVPFYWATVRISQQRNQLFSAVLGNSVGISSARASAAVVGEGLDASIVLLNQAGDNLTGGSGQGFPGTGTNLNAQGGGSVQVPGGILMASDASGGPYAGNLGGSSSVTSNYTYINQVGSQAGWVNGCAPGSTTCSGWTPTPANRGKQSLFDDPYAGDGQPPLTSQVLPNCPVLNGSLPDNAVLSPGNYYSVSRQTINGSQVYVPDGQPITIGHGGATFSAVSSGTAIDYSGGTVGTNNCQAGGTPVGPTSNTFGNYVFWGGLSGGNGQNTVVTIDPGRYVVAGSGGLNFQSNATLTDTSTSNGATGGPGELFILTDYNYPGLNTQYNNLSVGTFAFSSFNNQFNSFGSSGLQGGSQSTNTLHGIDPGNSLIQGLTETSAAGTKLSGYGSLAIWQDQSNSYVHYDSNGIPNGSCSSFGTCPSGNAPQFKYQGSSSSRLFGVIYQPRGAWMFISGGSLSAGKNQTQIVTGALTLQGNASVDFGLGAIPPTIRLAALVE